MRDKFTFTCGILFILTCTAFLVSNMVLMEPLVDTENYSNTFQLVKDNAFQYRLAVFIGFMGVVAQVALVITLFQILKPINQYLALLALGWRIGEQVILAVLRIADFLILRLSQTVVLPPGNGMAELDYLGQLLFSASSQGIGLALAMVFFSIGSIFNNILFYKSKAIPPFLAILGLIGAVLTTISTVLSIIIDLPTVIAKGAFFPIVIFEFTLGFYLIFRGMKKEIS